MSEGLLGSEGMGRMVRMFGKMALLPLSTFAAGTDALAQMARGLQTAAGQGMDNMSEGLSGALASEPEERGGESLADDQVKLVDYAIVSIHQGREEVLHRQQMVLIDNVSEEAFGAWRIADYLADEGEELSPDEREDLRVYLKVLERWPAEEAV